MLKVALFFFFTFYHSVSHHICRLWPWLSFGFYLQLSLACTRRRSHTKQSANPQTHEVISRLCTSCAQWLEFTPSACSGELKILLKLHLIQLNSFRSFFLKSLGRSKHFLPCIFILLCLMFVCWWHNLLINSAHVYGRSAQSWAQSRGIDE